MNADHKLKTIRIISIIAIIAAIILLFCWISQAFHTRRVLTECQEILEEANSCFSEYLETGNDASYTAGVEAFREFSDIYYSSDEFPYKSSDVLLALINLEERKARKRDIREGLLPVLTTLADNPKERIPSEGNLYYFNFLVDDCSWKGE